MVVSIFCMIPICSMRQCHWRQCSAQSEQKACFGASVLLVWDNGKENGNYRDYRGYIGVMWGLYRDYRVYTVWGVYKDYMGTL